MEDAEESEPVVSSSQEQFNQNSNHNMNNVISQNGSISSQNTDEHKDSHHSVNVSEQSDESDSINNEIKDESTNQKNSSYDNSYIKSMDTNMNNRRRVGYQRNSLICNRETNNDSSRQANPNNIVCQSYISGSNRPTSSRRCMNNESNMTIPCPVYYSQNMTSVSQYSEQPFNQAAIYPNSRNGLCRTTLFSKVLGPTADQTILQGLQTIMNFGCLKQGDDNGETVFCDCGDATQLDPVSQHEQNILQSGLPSSAASASQTSKPSVKSKNMQASSGVPSIVSEDVQTLDEDKPITHSELVQTPTIPTQSESFQTSCPYQLTCEAAQTSAVEMQSENFQTTILDLQKRDKGKGMSNTRFADYNKSSNSSFASVPTRNCSCCTCKARHALRKSSSNINGQSSPKLSCTCSSKIKNYNRNSTTKYDYCQGYPGKNVMCKCTPATSNSDYQNSYKKSFTSSPDVSIVQSMEGTQQNFGSPEEVRYAITKITKFPDYTTYEIMKSTKKKPRCMPSAMEGVFVLTNCDCIKEE